MKVHSGIWGLCVCVLGVSDGFREAGRSVFPLLSLDTTQKWSLALDLHPPSGTARQPLPGVLSLPPQPAWPPCRTAASEVARLALPQERSRAAAASACPVLQAPGRRARPLPPPPRSRARDAGGGAGAPKGRPRPGSRVCLETLRGFVCVVICSLI